MIYELFLSLVAAPGVGVCRVVGLRWVPALVGWCRCSVGWPQPILSMCTPALDKPNSPASYAEATVLPQTILPLQPEIFCFPILEFSKTDTSSLTLHVFLSGRMCIFCWYELIFEYLPFPYGVVSSAPLFHSGSAPPLIEVSWEFCHCLPREQQWACDPLTLPACSQN